MRERCRGSEAQKLGGVEGTGERHGAKGERSALAYDEDKNEVVRDSDQYSPSAVKETKPTCPPLVGTSRVRGSCLRAMVRG
mgnify:CR=1 FL=1